MHINTTTGTDASPSRLFEVTFAEWGSPITVIAPDFKTAAAIANEHRGHCPDTRSMLIWDASNVWKGVSRLRQAHTDQALAAGTMGVAVYEDEEGWMVTPVPER